jgi:hypothetical protein
MASFGSARRKHQAPGDGHPDTPRIAPRALKREKQIMFYDD